MHTVKAGKGAHGEEVTERVDRAEAAEHLGEMNYRTATKLLNSLRRGPRPAAPDLSPDAANIEGHLCVRGRPATAGMKEWLGALGYSTDDPRFPDLIHVAGTKGKGSTCAWTECLLRQRGPQTGYPKKTGLYTSPHLQDVRERIRINFRPISEDLFAKYVSEVHEALKTAELNSWTPRYLQFLFLVATHAFVQEQVDVAIYEAHQGGEFDATNILSTPLVTAITPIDRDHMHQLGPTIEHVAWHKSGIFKPGASALSAPQGSVVASVLKSRAEEKGVALAFVTMDFPANLPVPESDVQLVNFALACAITDEVLRRRSQAVLSLHDKRQAVQIFSWPGRFQKIRSDNFTWFLDGAHNNLSMVTCATWFASQTKSTTMIHRILVFTHFSTHRDHAALLDVLASSLSRCGVVFQDALFVTSTYATSPLDDEQTAILDMYAKQWKAVFPTSRVHRCTTPNEALQLVRTLARTETHVLVTGCLHHVGESMRILGVNVA